MKNEIKRKLIHLSSIYIPLLQFYFGTRMALLFLVPITLFIFLLNYIIIRIRKVRRRAIQIFKKIARLNEFKRFSGASFFLLSSIITMLIFDDQVSFKALMILIFCDTFASLSGLYFKGKKIFAQKTFAGFSGFVIVGIVLITHINIFVFHMSSKVILFDIYAVILTGFAELFSTKIKIDDNIVIPLTYGCANFLLQLVLN